MTSNCECECDKSCDIGEYLDYKNCKCRKRIIDKLVEECSENIYENVIPSNVYKNVCNSCMVYTVLFVVFLIASICCAFFYFHWYLKKDNITTNFSVGCLNILMTTKQIDIKNRTYYFYNDLINIKNFDPNMLRLDKKRVLNNRVYYIGYVTEKPEYNINSVNPLYLMINRIKGHFEEKDEDKYLIISPENGDTMQKYQEVFDRLKEIIKKNK